VRRACALGLDLGTSGIKAVLIAEDGFPLAEASQAYEVSSPHPGWAETDPGEWERAAHAVVDSVLAAVPDAELVGVGIDGQMHGAVLVDEHARPVRPAVLWPDSRAGSELQRWRELPAATVDALANPLAPGMAGPILAWLGTHEPDTMALAQRFLSPKDWLRTRLVSDAVVTDPSDASATLLWSVALDDWDRDLCAAVGVDPDLLAPLRPSASAAGTIRANSSSWGLPADLPVSVGCADAAATLLGTPAVPGRYTLTVGTGAQIVLTDVVPSATGPVRYHTYRQAGEGYYAMAALMNAGLVLTRVVRLLNATWDELYSPYDGSRALPGFIPFWSGERLPVAVSGSMGSWYDLGLGSERADLLAAALEGVAFAVRRVLEPFPPATDEVIQIAGGGSRHPVFVQLLADVLGRPLRRVPLQDATAVGAGLLGWHAAGRPADVVPGPTGALVEPGGTDVTEPLHQRYQRFLTQCEQIGATS
jgi:xylulokinase